MSSHPGESLPGHAANVQPTGASQRQGETLRVGALRRYLARLPDQGSVIIRLRAPGATESRDIAVQSVEDSGEHWVAILRAECT